jgi:hypothetical protein
MGIMEIGHDGVREFSSFALMVMITVSKASEQKI